MLSGLRAEELRSAISQGNIGALTAVPGVGKKTAERIVLELADKIEKTSPAQTSVSPSSKQLKSRSEALVALMSLGYTRSSAEQALRQALGEAAGSDPSVEELVRLALRRSAR
jgi:Holliday junction DNA helicase RuvA